MFRQVTLRSRGFRTVRVCLVLCTLWAASCGRRHEPALVGYWDEAQPATADPSGPIEQLVLHADGTYLRNLVQDTSLTSTAGEWESKSKGDSVWQLVVHFPEKAGTEAAYQLTLVAPGRMVLSDSQGVGREFLCTLADTALAAAIDTTENPFPAVTLWARPDYEQELSARLKGASAPESQKVRDIMVVVERSWQQARQQLRWGRRFRREGALNLQAADSARAQGQAGLADSLAQQVEINRFQKHYHLEQSWMYESMAEHNLKRCDELVPGVRALVRSARPLVRDTTRSGN